MSQNPQTDWLPLRKRWLVFCLLASLVTASALALFQEVRPAIDYAFYPPPFRLKAVAVALLQYKQEHGAFPPLQVPQQDDGPALSWRWIIREKLDDFYRSNETNVVDKAAYAPKLIRSERGPKTDVFALCRGGNWNAELTTNAIRVDGLRVLCVAGSPLPDAAWTSTVELDLEKYPSMLNDTEWLLLEDGSVVNRNDVGIAFPSDE